MSTGLLYLIPVLIWGSTWLAIKFQLGVVSPEFSVAYRFLLASILLFIYCRARGMKLRFSWNEHLFILLQGVFLFSVNYILVYFAEVNVTSGLVSVIFSTLLVFNVLFGAVFLGDGVRWPRAVRRAGGHWRIGADLLARIAGIELAKRGTAGSGAGAAVGTDGFSG